MITHKHKHKLYTQTTAATATYECVFSLVLNNEGRPQVDRTIKSPGVDESRVTVLSHTASPRFGIHLLFLHRFGRKNTTTTTTTTTTTAKRKTGRTTTFKSRKEPKQKGHDKNHQFMMLYLHSFLFLPTLIFTFPPYHSVLRPLGKFRSSGLRIPEFSFSLSSHFVLLYGSSRIKRHSRRSLLHNRFLLLMRIYALLSTFYFGFFFYYHFLFLISSSAVVFCFFCCCLCGDY